MIIGRSGPALNSSRTLRAVRRQEIVCRRDENSRRTVQNVCEDRWLNISFDELLYVAPNGLLHESLAVQAGGADNRANDIEAQVTLVT